MAVDDHGIEVLKKSGEEVTIGDKSDYYIKVGSNINHPVSVDFRARSLDSFDRLRTSSVTSVFNIYHSHSAHDLLFENTIVGTASSTFNATHASVDLTVGTASGDSISRQTKRYLQYNPGRSYMVSMSCVPGAPKTNVRQRWGFFDSNDGLFFEQLSTGIGVVLRTSTSGSPVDARVAQSSFNLDKLDGTGQSGFTLDTSKHNLFVIDYVWQGAGRVRFGLVNDGKVLYCHELRNNNVNPTVFMRTPSLPMRGSITNLGTTASSTTMKMTCWALNKESTDKTIPSYIFAISREASNLTVGSGATGTLISIRPKLTFNSMANRVQILPFETPIISISNPLLVRLFKNSTLTGAVWASADANSAVEYDVTATSTFTDGQEVKAFFVGGLAGQSAVAAVSRLSDILYLSLSADGTASDTMTISVTNLGSGNTFVNGSFIWEEYQ